MSKIYRTTDVIPVKVDSLVVGISPLTFEQKMQVQSQVLKGGTDAAMRGAKLALQSAIKSIKGLEDASGKAYEIDIKDGKLTDECWEDLQNIEETPKLITVCLALINGVPKEFVDPETKKKIPGVSFITAEDSKQKKK